MQQESFLHLLGHNFCQQLYPYKFSLIEAIDFLYRIDVECYSEIPPNMQDDLLGEKLTLKIVYWGKVRYFHGYVSKISQQGDLQENRVCCQLQLRPQFWFLEKIVDCKIYSNNSVIEILQAVQDQFALTEMEWMIFQDQYPKQEHIIQYNESVLHFTLRLMARYNIHFMFVHDANSTNMLLFNSIQQLPQMNFELNNIKPSMNNEGVFFLQDIHRIHQAQKTLGKSNALNLPLGQLWKNSLIENSNMVNLRITAIKHFGHDYSHSKKIENSKQVYDNLFCCRKDSQALMQRCRYQKPIVTGYHIGKVIADENGKSMLDNRGYLKVCLVAFQKPEMAIADACVWLPILQQQSTKNYFSHFLPDVNEEIIIAFENADIDKPVGLGSAYNSENSPVFSLPQQQTSSGYSKKGQAVIFNDDNKEAAVYIKAEGRYENLIKGDSNIQIAQSMQTSIFGGQNINIAKEFTIEAEDNINLQTEKTKINISKEGIEIMATSVNLNLE